MGDVSKKNIAETKADREAAVSINPDDYVVFIDDVSGTIDESKLPPISESLKQEISQKIDSLLESLEESDSPGW